MSLDQVDRALVINPVHGRDPTHAWLHRFEGHFSYQVCKQINAACGHISVQLSDYSPAPLSPPELCEHLSEQDGQLRTSSRGLAQSRGRPPPFPETRPGHVQQRGPPNDRIFDLLHIDQRAAMAYGCLLAKKTAAFSKGLFSIRSLGISSSNSATRARSTRVRACSGLGLDRFHKFTQLISAPWLISNSRATSATGGDRL